MNSTKNRMTGFSPKQAQHNVDLIAARRLAAYGRKYKNTKKTFEIGDRVRRRLHRPRYTYPYWSKATYRIVAVNVPKNHVVALTSYKIALWNDATKIRRGVYKYVSSLQGPIKAVEYGPEHEGSDNEDDEDSSGDDVIIPNPPAENNDDEESDEEPLLDPRIHRRPTATKRRELDDLNRTAPRPRNATRRPV